LNTYVRQFYNDLSKRGNILGRHVISIIPTMIKTGNTYNKIVTTAYYMSFYIESLLLKELIYDILDSLSYMTYN